MWNLLVINGEDSFTANDYPLTLADVLNLISQIDRQVLFLLVPVDPIPSHTCESTDVPRLST